MKVFFTPKSGLLLMLTVFTSLLLNIQAFAQNPYLDPSLGAGSAIVRSDVFVGDKQGRVPAKEGLFTKQMSGWLSDNGEVLQGEVIHVGPGCNIDTYLNNPVGKIALIERGGCTFYEKINRAYNSGAVAVIGYNNEAGGDALVDMGSSLGNVPIPGFFVGRTAGLTLAATPVLVKVQAASFKALKDAVTALQLDGTLTKKQAGSLKDKISAASQAAYVADFVTALNLVTDFQAEILALANAGVLCCPPPPPPTVAPPSDWQALNLTASILAQRLQPPYTNALN